MIGGNELIDIEGNDAIELTNNINYLYLNSRTFEEHKKKLINSQYVCIPVQKIYESIGVLEKFRDKKIIFYFRTGNCLITVTKKLKKMGLLLTTLL